MTSHVLGSSRQSRSGATDEDDDVASHIAASLHSLGVTRAFGVPGEDHLRLLDAISNQGIDYIAARDESAAAIMASADAETTGGLGVVIVTLAPGITNAINGIANAYLDELPVLVLVGQHSADRLTTIVRQNLDNRLIVSGVTKAAMTMGSNAAQGVIRAAAVALAAPQGPVLLEVPDSVTRRAPAPDSSRWLREPSPTTKPKSDARLDDAIIHRLEAAKRPAIIVGGSQWPTEFGAQLAAVAERLRAPLFLTPTASGLVTTENPWFAGTFLHGNPERRLLESCDVILAIDVRPAEIFNTPWSLPAGVIALRSTPDIHHVIPVELGWVGDLSAALRELEQGEKGTSTWQVSEVEAYRVDLARIFRSETHQFTIPTAIRIINGLLPADGYLTVDAGFGKPITAYLWESRRPGRYFSSHGLSTMGYAVPAANALQLRHRDATVVAFLGDGSLLMRAAEISVAAEHALPCIYVVWLDGTLSQIQVKQRRQGLKEVGTSIPNFSCSAIAKAFGADGYDVSTASDLKAAVSAGLANRRQPTLVGVRVSQADRATWFEALRG